MQNVSARTPENLPHSPDGEEPESKQQKQGMPADLVLDASPDDRHVMQGVSEPDLLQLETSAPQVHRDSVVFTTQVLAAKQWRPGYADFTQAFHSGDAIGRALYCTQPPEGIPGTSPCQLIRLTDGWPISMVLPHHQVPHSGPGIPTIDYRSLPLLS